MGYSLAVFVPDVVPRPKMESWLEEQSGQQSVHRAESHSVVLNTWFAKMRARFPAMNGPFQLLVADDETVDYGVADFLVVVSASWSQAEEVLAAAFQIAEPLGLGIFDADASGDLFLPEGAKLQNAGKPNNAEDVVVEEPLSGPQLRAEDLTATLRTLDCVARGNVTINWVSASQGDDGAIELVYRVVERAADDSVAAISEYAWPLVRAQQRGEPQRVHNCVSALHQWLGASLTAERAHRIRELAPLWSRARSIDGFRQVFDVTLR